MRERVPAFAIWSSDGSVLAAARIDPVPTAAACSAALGAS
jgi:hypothetical protein